MLVVSVLLVVVLVAVVLVSGGTCPADPHEGIAARDSAMVLATQAQATRDPTITSSTVAGPPGYGQ